MRYTLSFCLVPSLSPLPLLSPCGNCWTGFLLYASYWHSSSHSSFLPLLPSTTSISLIFIFLLSFSPTYSVSPYHSPLTVIASPAVSHCVRALSVSVCVMAHFVCVHSCVYSVCVIFHGLAYSNFWLYVCHTQLRRTDTHETSRQLRSPPPSMCIQSCANPSA